MNITRQIGLLTPILVFLALAILGSGLYLQWRLSQVATDPQTVAYIGQEKHLVNSMQAAAVGMLNASDQESISERLEKLRTSYNQLQSNHARLVAIANKSSTSPAIVNELNKQVFPRYDRLRQTALDIFARVRTGKQISLSSAKPIILDFKEQSELYLFFVDRLDLKFANLGQVKLEELQFAEAVLIIGSGILLLLVLLVLFSPLSRLLKQYKRDLNMLQKADKEKNRFLAILGHELRNPLASISGGLQVMRIMPEKREEMLEMMEESVNIMSALLDDLLDITRISRGEIRLHQINYDFAETLHAVVLNMQPMILAKQQTLNVSYPQSTPWVYGDPVRLEQIVSNLLNNAVKFTPEGGTLTLKSYISDSEIYTIVKDTGRGIAPERLQVIFNPFTQGRAEEDGTRESGLGLGLALAKELALAHGGTIEARSKGPGKGAEFIFRLPISQIKEQEFKPELYTDTRLEEGLRILLVDDNLNAIQGVAAALEEEGCQVTITDNAAKALEIAADNIFDIFLVDIEMPHINGYELSRRLRELGYDDALIVAISGYGHEAARAQSHEAGIDYHLNKPIAYQRLKMIMREWTETQMNLRKITGLQKEKSTKSGPAHEAP